MFLAYFRFLVKREQERKEGSIIKKEKREEIF